jgi:DNA-directed RNA polymerase subunit M
LEHFIDYNGKNIFEATLGSVDYKGVEKEFCGFFHNKSEIVKTLNDKNGDTVEEEDDNKADINTREKEHIKDIQQYQQYQENQQGQQPWSDSSDIRIVESDELPDPHPITDTEVCSKCGNRQARWWIVQTDSADEPSTQFFRCTKCNHTWRTTRSS